LPSLLANVFTCLVQHVHTDPACGSSEAYAEDLSVS